MSKTPSYVEQAMLAARAAINKDGFAAPMMVSADPQGELSLFIVGALFTNQVDQETRARRLRETLAQAGAVAYALITECWIKVSRTAEEVQETDKNLALGMPVREMTQQDGVIISYQNRQTGEKRVWQAFIHRHADEVWIGSFEEVQQPSGTMVGLLDDEESEVDGLCLN